jgi:hypothetical protein
MSARDHDQSMASQAVGVVNHLPFVKIKMPKLVSDGDISSAPEE